MLADKLKEHSELEAKDDLEIKTNSAKKSTVKKKYFKYSTAERQAVLALLPYKKLFEIERDFKISESTIRG